MGECPAKLEQLNSEKGEIRLQRSLPKDLSFVYILKAVLRFN